VESVCRIVVETRATPKLSLAQTPEHGGQKFCEVCRRRLVRFLWIDDQTGSYRFRPSISTEKRACRYRTITGDWPETIFWEVGGVLNPLEIIPGVWEWKPADTRDGSNDLLSELQFELWIGTQRTSRPGQRADRGCRDNSRKLESAAVVTLQQVAAMDVDGLVAAGLQNLGLSDTVIVKPGGRIPVDSVD
jgi:hypothetical protein